MENYYEFFGVKENASCDEIKQAYLKLIKKYHPDIYQGDKSYAEQKTAEINKRYLILKDENSRREYDRHLHPNALVVANSHQRNYTQNQKTNVSKEQDVDGIFVQLFKRLKNSFSSSKNQKIQKKQTKKIKKQKINKQTSQQLKKEEKKKTKKLQKDKAGLTLIIILVIFVIIAFLLLMVLV